jgi:hypothetical protein
MQKVVRDIATGLGIVCYASNIMTDTCKRHVLYIARAFLLVLVLPTKLNCEDLAYRRNETPQLPWNSSPNRIPLFV